MAEGSVLAAGVNPEGAGTVYVVLRVVVKVEVVSVTVVTTVDVVEAGSVRVMVDVVVTVTIS